MALEVYRDSSLTDTTDILNGVNLEATLGSETVELLFAAESTTGLIHRKFVSAFWSTLTGQEDYDHNNDNVDDIFLYVSAPTLSTGHTQQIVASGGETSLQLNRKYIKPGTFTVDKNSSPMTPIVDYHVNYLAGIIYFDTALTVSDVMDFTFDHGDDGAGNVNQPSNATIKANGTNTRVSLWDIPERGNGVLKGASPDGVPFFVLVELAEKVLDYGGGSATPTIYDVSITALDVTGAYDG